MIKLLKNMGNTNISGEKKCIGPFLDVRNVILKKCFNA